MNNTNLWTWKDSEIVDALDSRGITMESYTRKEAIQLLREAMLKEAQGDINETKTYIDALKEKEPTLILRKVIFHSTSETDIPYVPVGHNGRAFYLPKETPIEVPKYILDSCIKDAVEERMYPETNMQGDINWKIKKVQRFPYSIVED